MAVDDLQKLGTGNNMRGQKEGGQVEIASRQTIHSGHFMVSRVHDVVSEEFDDVPLENSDDAFDFVTANKETSKTYSFGPKSDHTLAIDASLTKLFECMTLAYSGTITSPKWKAFRGMHLTVKDKIRLNNIIWREWHMQYIYRQNPIICDFSTPLSDDIHSKPEAVVLEGKYWKRRLDTVTAEYKKWRKYFKERISREPPDIKNNMHEVLSIAELLERVKTTNIFPKSNHQASATDLQINGDFMEMDFTDNLFASLNQPFAFPNPKEFSQIGCADLIQPGLIQLQPNLDEFMDIDDILGTSKNQTVYNTTVPQDVTSNQNINLSAINMGMPQLAADYIMNNSINNSQQLNSQNITNTIDISAILNSQLIESLAQYSQTINQPSSLLYDKLRLTETGQPYSTNHNSQSTRNVTTAVTHNQSPTRSGRRSRPSGNTASSTVTSATPSHKRDGFAVPSKPVPRKQRSIAPATSTSPTIQHHQQQQQLQTPSLTPSQSTSSPSLQSTYLAQLLTKGTYPGALIKSEPRPIPPTPQLPKETTHHQQLSLTQHPAINYNKNNVTDTLDFIKATNDYPGGHQVLNSSSNVHPLSSPDSSFSSFGSPTSSPQNINPLSPVSPYPLSPSTRDTLSPSSSPGLSSIRDDDKGPFNETRRAAHLSAEQKRRCNLKNGFDMLVVLVPSLAQNPKASKADMLRKTAEFCKKLKAERIQMQKEADILKQEMETLHNSISIIQSQLPETGAPVTRQRVDQMKEMFDDYVKNSTLQNWKFWIFSIIIGPLFDSYNNMVSTASVDDLCRTVLAWLDQHCSLQSLRPIVSKALVHISTATSILTDPKSVRNHAIESVTKKRHSANKHSRS